MSSVFCIGAALIDETFSTIQSVIPGSSNPSKYSRSAGGVSNNIATHLARLGNVVELITHFGNDDEGKWLMKQCAEAGIGLTHSIADENPTGRYAAVIGPDGNLFVGAAAMNFEKILTVQYLEDHSHSLQAAAFIQADCNLGVDALQWIIRFCREKKIRCAIETVSVAKAGKLSEIDLSGTFLITPNKDELRSIAGDHSSIESMIEAVMKRGVQNVWLREGKNGSSLFNENGILRQEASSINIEDVTGAGDAALAGFIHFILRNKKIDECMLAGRAMAELVLKTKGSMLNTLTKQLLESEVLSIQHS
jgi:pseudouridine kinase